MSHWEEAARAFLAEAHHFRLGDLPTETPNPATADLSRLAREDLPRALRLLREVDLQALRMMLAAEDCIQELSEEVRATLQSGRRVFLCGCGATGRLSISLEVLWRKAFPAADTVVAFMAGGDLALVRSIENFEDHPEYGARQLTDLSFGEGDLLISCTEGGETPFVIGATEHAVGLSKRPPWFLYCNPDAALRGIERSRRVLDNPRIRKISLPVGPMAVSGSTRMQASTVLMLAAGRGLVPGPDFAAHLERNECAFLQPFIERESDIYTRGGYLLYETDDYGITILTDTTERAPTFSLRAFENLCDEGRVPSLCAFHLSGAGSASDAWEDLLHRPPRPLGWAEVKAVAGRERLLGFDFSEEGVRRRQYSLAGRPQATFRIKRGPGVMRWELEELQAEVPVEGMSPLEKHLLLKTLLNMHSTLVMGRLGRYEGNLMTYVRPSNNKLIDRAIRYVQHLLRQRGVDGFSYEDVARCCFEQMEHLAEDEPIVLKVYEAMTKA